jgi:hypothetical protein
MDKQENKEENKDINKKLEEKRELRKDEENKAHKNWKNKFEHK